MPSVAMLIAVASFKNLKADHLGLTINKIINKLITYFSKVQQFSFLSRENEKSFDFVKKFTHTGLHYNIF